MKRRFLIVLFCIVFAFSGCNTTNVNIENENQEDLNLPSDDDNNNEIDNSDIAVINDNVDEDKDDKSEENQSDDGQSIEDKEDKQLTDEEDKQGNVQNDVDTDETSDIGTIFDNLEEDEPKVPEYVVEDLSLELFVTKSVNVRTGPSTDYDRIGTLNKGDKIKITGKSKDWYRIDYKSENAFANSSFFADEEKYNEMIAKEEEALKQAQEDAMNKEAASTETNPPEPAPTPDNPPPAAAQSDADFRSRVVALCNEQRAANGLGPLTEDATLDSLAQVRSDETVVSFSHTRPNGTDCFTVLDSYPWNACGENIAAGQITPEEVVDAWMNSEGHRANILSPSFGKIGVGISHGGSYGIYWAQLFTN